MQTDHHLLEAIFTKSLGSATPRLQHMLLRLQRYELEVKWVPGELMYLADTLSRAYLPEEPNAEAEDDIEVMVHSVVRDVPLTAMRKEQIRDAAAEDPELRRVRQAVMVGWPRKKHAATSIVQEFWAVKDRMHIAEGVLFVDDRIVVPKVLQAHMLALLHETHQGGEKMKARAAEALYWPNMASDIEQSVANCSLCLHYRNSQPKEPLKQHPVPELAWQKVGANIFTYAGKDFMLVVDYLSKYPEVVEIEDKTSATVIMKMEIFARLGIPQELISDNIPFSSYDFKQFAKNWGIFQLTSSPGYAQSNGQSERFVQMIKRMMKKADGDVYLALLEYRNTPVAGTSYSPAQILTSRTLRSKIPVSQKTLRPKVVEPHHQLVYQKARQKTYFDRTARPLSELIPGDTVRIRRGKAWELASLRNADVHPRSYWVDQGGGTLRRNRRSLLKTSESAPVAESFDGDPVHQQRPPVEPQLPSVEPQTTHIANTQTAAVMPDAAQYRTRSGRAVKTPAKFQDFV